MFKTQWRCWAICLGTTILMLGLPSYAYYSDNPTAEKIYSQGTNLLHTGRYQEALDKLNQAIALDEHFVAAYINASSASNNLGKYDQAIMYANKALRDNNESSYAYGQRAYAYYELCQFGKALADYKKALQCEPDFEQWYYKCGLCLTDSGSYAEAIDYYNQALKRDPIDRQTLYMRGVSYLMLNKNEQAIADLTMHHRLVVAGVPHQRYDVLFCCVALRRVGKEKEAIKLASDYAKQMPPSEWPYPIIKYFAKQLTAKDLLAAAKADPRQVTEAKAYIGADLADSGKKKEAIEQLVWVKQNGNRTFSEYQLALSELKKLGVK